MKEWVKTGDRSDTKFLSYTYHALTDTFSARPKINWSPRKRGIRKSADCKSMVEVKSMAELYGLTKRTVASILMGTIHDPLGLFLPYVNNLKLVYQDICRQGTEWDKPISESMKLRVMEALNFFYRHRKCPIPQESNLS